MFSLLWLERSSAGKYILHIVLICTFPVPELIVLYGNSMYRMWVPVQSRLSEPGSHRRPAAASLATLASDEAAGHL